MGSLHRFKKFYPKKYTPPLHRYFATSLQKVLSKKIYPLATSLLRYFASKISLRKNIPPCYIATSLLCFKHFSPKKYTPQLHRYFATLLQKALSKKIYPPATSLHRFKKF